MASHLIDTVTPYINLFFHWRSVAIDFIVIKVSFFVPLCHLLCPQPLVLQYADSARCSTTFRHIYVLHRNLQNFLGVQSYKVITQMLINPQALLSPDNFR